MPKDKLLIVDDEHEIADLILLYLENEGFQVFKFYNAALQCGKIIISSFFLRKRTT